MGPSALDGPGVHEAAHGEKAKQIRIGVVGARHGEIPAVEVAIGQANGDFHLLVADENGADDDALIGGWIEVRAGGQQPQGHADHFASGDRRYATTPSTILRFGVTTGIARANYSDLPPHVAGQLCSTCALKFTNLIVGNPELKPQHAWNVDLHGEHDNGSRADLHHQRPPYSL